MTPTRVFYAALLCAGMITCIMSCASSKKIGEKHNEKPDYSLEDVRRIEIEKIHALIEDKAVEALWRAFLVDDNALINSCVENIASKFASAYTSKDYFGALNLYRSLEAANRTDAVSVPVSSFELEELCNENVPGLAAFSTSAGTGKESISNSADIAKYISGTVTIWVDQGIKVENGVGYADRVIGSGFFIDKSGYIVTNHHVISNVVSTKYEGVARLFIKLSSDSESRIPAKVIGWDSVLDLALLKTEIDAPYVFDLGSSAGLAVGDKIYAIGSPIGLDRTLTSGIVSATNRKLFTSGGVFQIDAAVNAGNSGGPCIDVNGKVQAIVFAGIPEYQGLNFAIPVEYLKNDLPMLFRGGEREHPWINAYGHTMKSGVESIGLEVQYVLPSGSACWSNIVEGDVITAINGIKISSLEDFQSVMRRYMPGVIVKLDYIHADGENAKALVYLNKRPKYPGYTIYKNDLMEQAFYPIFGMKLESVSTMDSRKYAVSKLIAGGIADESGFSENDPVDVRRIKFSEDKSAIYAEMSIKNRKKGYLDVGIALAAPLDSPYYF